MLIKGTKVSGGLFGPSIYIPGGKYMGVFASIRRGIRGYSGQCCQLVRDADSDIEDFGFDSNGILDQAAVQSWLTAGGGPETARVAIVYDQTGNSNDFTQTDPNFRFDIGLNSIGSLPSFIGYKTLYVSGPRNTFMRSNMSLAANQGTSVGVVGRSRIQDFLLLPPGSSSFQAMMSGTQTTKWWVGFWANPGPPVAHYFFIRGKDASVAFLPTYGLFVPEVLGFGTDLNTSHQCYLNGRLVHDSSNDFGGAWISNQATGQIYWGQSNTYFWHGDLTEHFVCDKKLSLETMLAAQKNQSLFHNSFRNVPAYP